MPRVLIGLGVLLVIAGGALWGLERAGLRLGRLPGDLSWGSGNVRVYFPIGTCIVLSAVVTFILWAIGSVRR